MLKSFVLVKLAYNAASIALFFFSNPIYAQIMLVFQNSATFFFNVMLDKKWTKQ